MKGSYILALTLAGGAAVWGGFALKHEMRCRGLSKDFLNASSSVRLNATLQTLTATNTDLKAALDRMNQLDSDQMEQAIKQLATECGTRRAESAIRQATEF